MKTKNKRWSKKKKYKRKCHNNVRKTYNKKHIKNCNKQKKNINYAKVDRNIVECDVAHSLNSETPEPSLEDLEIQMLHKAMEEATEKNPQKLTYSSEIKEIIKILEDFIREKKLICYGGTAINNILGS